MLTQERLKVMLHYDPETGLWTWLWCPPPNQRYTGTQAGYTRSDGYNLIRIGGTAYYCSRLAHLYMTGKWPEEEVDHKDRDPNNDKWENLREATSSQNKINRGLNSSNTSGFRGVSFNKARGKWVAYVDTLQLGAFDTIEEAVAARDSAAKDIHGEFAILNSKENKT